MIFQLLGECGTTVLLKFFELLTLTGFICYWYKAGLGLRVRVSVYGLRVDSLVNIGIKQGCVYGFRVDSLVNIGIKQGCVYGLSVGSLVNIGIKQGCVYGLSVGSLVNIGIKQGCVYGLSVGSLVAAVHTVYCQTVRAATVLVIYMA